MTFETGKEGDFLNVFNNSSEKIRSFNGCEFLELLRDVNQTNIFFTHSIWKSEKHLEKYRNSFLFKETWASTKVLFSDKPQAWSLIKK
ncbi:MAG TPA: antibiotic biosynthesis monooxygenase family protein [Bacteroidia bacterium]|nr:antibiotic biosynthesis monooxygenase family protein [Bacteroidia bacterium]